MTAILADDVVQVLFSLVEHELKPDAKTWLWLNLLDGLKRLSAPFIVRERLECRFGCFSKMETHTDQDAWQLTRAHRMQFRQNAPTAGRRTNRNPNGRLDIGHRLEISFQKSIDVPAQLCLVATGAGCEEIREAICQ